MPFVRRHPSSDGLAMAWPFVYAVLSTVAPCGPLTFFRSQLQRSRRMARTCVIQGCATVRLLMERSARMSTSLRFMFLMLSDRRQAALTRKLSIGYNTLYLIDDANVAAFTFWGREEPMDPKFVTFICKQQSLPNTCKMWPTL